MPKPLEEFRSFLASRGKRLTREREIVATVAFALRPPFTAESVVTAVSLMSTDIRVSRATIYRTLQSLANSGQLVTETGGGESQYTHMYKPRLDNVSISDLCKDTHKDMIAGTCPWCGCAIRNGRPEDDFI